MIQRSVEIESALALSDAGSKSINITPGAPISAIELIFGATKGATENQSDKISQYVTKIELVDGANVLASVSMQELMALNAFQLGDLPAHDMDLAASGTPQESAWLIFGRYLFDPDYYLDPSNYRNLQLKVTTNCTAAAGTYVTGTFTIDIICHVIDEGYGAYNGFFSPKTVYTWTTVASGVVTIDMPQDYPYLHLLMGAGETAVAPSTDVTNWKMSCDADKHIVFDMGAADLVLRNRSQFGPFNNFLQSAMQDTDTLDAALHDIISVALIGGDEDFACRAKSTAGPTITMAFSAQT